MEHAIEVVFDNADAAHRQHLLSEKLSEHLALGEFYVSAREKLDAFVEAAIALDMPLPPLAGTPILDQLESGYVELVEMRDSACQNNPTLLNLFDELTATYTAAIYKLKRLA